MREDFAIPNGTVHALVEVNGTLYVGGAFTRIGPKAAFGAVLSATTGEAVWRPKIDDYVSDAAPDGSGGWFIGGIFDQVGGVPHDNLAHLRADGTIAPWSPLPGANVDVVAVDGATVYVGGIFAQMNGQTRIKVAAVDAETGALKPWDAHLDYVNSSWVGALAVSGGRVYIGGEFYSQGLTQKNLIAVDATTGALANWNPVVDGLVTVIAVGPDAVYFGGDFTSVDGVPRAHLAAVDIATGRVTPWNPGANGRVSALEVNGSTLYVGGSFDSIGGVPRRGLAAFELATGELTPWDAGIGSGGVGAIAVSGSTVYVGGYFFAVGGQPRDHVAAVDAVTGHPTAWDPGAYDAVGPLVVQGDHVFVGGIFPSIGAKKRRNLAAVDVASGSVTDWNPGANHTIRALAAEGELVYAGGSFDSIGAERRRRIAAIDRTSGMATGWDPGADGGVRALAVSGPLVYAGGLFTFIGGQPRHRIAALDRSGGFATDWDPNADSTVRAIVVDGDIVYAGGTFRRIGGADRPLVAAIDASTGSATDWVTHSAGVNPDVYALGARGSALYVAGDFTHMGGQPRRGLAGLDMATGAATAWSPSVTLTRYALGLVGTRATGAPEIVYAGGEGVAALDGETADPVGWNPEVFGPVYALGVGSSHVFIGGEIEGTGIRSLRLAAVVEHSTATLVAMFAAEAVTEGIVLRWRIAAPELVSSWIERAESAGGPWERPALEVRDRGEEHEALDRGVEASRTYHYRLLANDGRESIVLGTLTATAGAQYERHALTRIVPVPSAGRTGIDFVTARSSPVRLRIFDLHGRIEAELVDEILPAGNHRVIWTGQGVRGRSPAGIYFARLDVDGHGMARRIVLSR